MKDMEKLSHPFDTQEVKWRVGSTNTNKTSGIALAYVDARVVMERLDDVIGSLNWEDQYTETAKGRIICSISIKDSDGNWITKSDGAGSTTFEGEKGAISDAFKRAAVKWGIGRYLYNLDSPWVKIEKNRIPNTELARLYKLLPNAPQGNNKQEDLEETSTEKKDEDISSLAWWQSDMEQFKHLGDAENWKEKNKKRLIEMKEKDKEAFNQLVNDYKEYEDKLIQQKGNKNG
tara:strand:- start:6254 stop:6949 length:696 start_codon:yes stop_codon:yes gene_type:complete